MRNIVVKGVASFAGGYRINGSMAVLDGGAMLAPAHLSSDPTEWPGDSVGALRGGEMFFNPDLGSDGELRLRLKSSWVTVTHDSTIAHFEETFTATSSKTVIHNLGEQPQVTVRNSSNVEVRTTVTHTSENQLRLTFSGTLTSAVVFCDTGAGISIASHKLLSVSAKTADYTAAIGDELLLFDCSSSNLTCTLPTAVGNTGAVLRVKKIDSSLNTLTVDGNGAETVDDGTTALITLQYETITVCSDGTEWWII